VLWAFAFFLYQCACKRVFGRLAIDSALLWPLHNKQRVSFAAIFAVTWLPLAVGAPIPQRLQQLVSILLPVRCAKYIK